jgi:hypothetical protein
MCQVQACRKKPPVANSTSKTKSTLGRISPGSVRVSPKNFTAVTAEQLAAAVNDLLTTLDAVQANLPPTAHGAVAMQQNEHVRDLLRATLELIPQVRHAPGTNGAYFALRWLLTMVGGQELSAGALAPFLKTDSPRQPIGNSAPLMRAVESVAGKQREFERAMFDAWRMLGRAEGELLAQSSSQARGRQVGSGNIRKSTQRLEDALRDGTATGESIADQAEKYHTVPRNVSHVRKRVKKG